MDVTLLGMVMEVRPRHSWKAAKPMDVKLLGMVVFLQPQISVFVEDSMIALQLFLESYLVLPLSTSMDVRSHLRKTVELMDVTLLGMVTEVRPLQPTKAVRPMDVTLLGMVMEVRPRQ